MAESDSRNYWVVRMWQGKQYADRGYAENYVGVHFIDQDLSEVLSLPRKTFIKKVSPALKKQGGTKKRQIAQAAGQLFRFASLMKIGDIVLLPHTEEGKLYAGTVESDYKYVPGKNDGHFPHQRSVRWIKEISREELSEDLKNSIGAIMTTFSASSHAEELATLISGGEMRTPGGEKIEDPKEFGLESNLEDFIVYNWSKLPMSKQYDIYKDEDGRPGKQYEVDVGRIDVLARSKNGKEWLVIELKKGKTGDVVVGQILRYMGYIRSQLADPGDKVSGLLIAGSEDDKLQYAVSSVPDITFMTYSVDFKLK